MARRGGFVWTFNSLVPAMLVFDEVVDQVIEERLEEAAERIEEYMKINAPWEDQTGEAREGLGAEADGKTITLYHSVDYGIWLEVRWSGRYAIILPTIEVMGPEVMAMLGGTMEADFT